MCREKKSWRCGGRGPSPHQKAQLDGGGDSTGNQTAGGDARGMLETAKGGGQTFMEPNTARQQGKKAPKGRALGITGGLQREGNHPQGKRHGRKMTVRQGDSVSEPQRRTNSFKDQRAEKLVTCSGRRLRRSFS